MARLKVKQIADFESAVNTLINSNDTDDAASITSLATAIATEQGIQDESINSLELVVSGGVGSLGDSVDSLESAVSDVASDLSDYEGDTNDSIHSLESVDASIIKDLADYVALNTDSIHSLESIDDGLSAEISVEASRIDVILGGASADYDTFVEIYNLITDIDTANDDAFSTYVVSNNNSIHSLESVDASIVKDLADYVALNDSSIHSLEAVDATLGDSVDSLESAVSAVASDLSDYEGDTNDSITSLEDVDGTLAASVDSLETLAGEAFGSAGRIHQMGAVAGATTFSIATAVDVSADADCVVFVNGKNEQMKMASNTNGWSSTNGLDFTLTAIGYDIDAEDEVYVIAPLAGTGAGSDIGGGDVATEGDNLKARE